MAQEHRPNTPQLGVAQVLAAALASVSAAAVASTFGLAGTLIGAAVTSAVATVAGALYASSIERARTRIHWRRNPRTGQVEREVVTETRTRAFPWRVALGGTAIVFLLALGTITAVEVVAHEPLSRLLGHGSPGGSDTTVGTLVQGAPNPAPTSSAPQPTATAAPTSGPTPAATLAAPAPTAGTKPSPQPSAVVPAASTP